VSEPFLVRCTPRPLRLVFLAALLVGCGPKKPVVAPATTIREGEIGVLPRAGGQLCAAWRADKTTGADVVEVVAVDPPSCTLTTRFMHESGSTSITVSTGDVGPQTRPSSGPPHDRRVELIGDDGTAAWSLWFSQRDLGTAAVASEPLHALDLAQMRFLVVRLWDERDGVRRAYSWTVRSEDPSVNRNSCKDDVRITAFDAGLEEVPAGFAGRPAEASLLPQHGACSTEEAGVYGLVIPDGGAATVGLHLEVHNWATDPFRVVVELPPASPVVVTDVVLVHDAD
jgi:hypothetical protein